MNNNIKVYFELYIYEEISIISTQYILFREKLLFKGWCHFLCTPSAAGVRA